jgi:Uma2 family endonuclease
MATASLVSVDEYLSTSYQDGDREYVDGEVRERNIGEFDHANLQTALAVYLHHKYNFAAITVVGARVQVKPTRFRVPDISVLLERPKGGIITEPPFIVVEVLSKDDRVIDLEDTVEDYLAFGVPNVWVLNPQTRSAQIYSPEGMHRVADGYLRTASPEIVVNLAELF